MYYVIENCVSGTQIVTEVDLSLHGISVFDFFHAEGWKHCFQVIAFSEGNPPVEPSIIVPIGPVFGTCIDCLNGTLGGCVDPTACNFNPCATFDDGSCFYNNVTIKILCNKPLTNCNINSNCKQNGK